MPLRQGHCTSLGHGQKLCEISSSNLDETSNGPDTDFGYVYTDLDPENMTFGQDHDIPCDQGQQLCEILSRSGERGGHIKGDVNIK